ncbi:F-box only protein 44 isoform X2 [Anabrus simplex]|uniref:F-box only protein 44 isoform X2 n=1 Tax=Anabrus simplex TaxID=316456 RepID=UPI0035A2790A
MNVFAAGSSGDTGPGMHLSEYRNFEEINGLFLDGKCIPEDILGILLSYLDSDSLLKCRLVCQIWKQVIDTDVWRLKINNETYRLLQTCAARTKYPWIIYFWICKRNPFWRNLLKNHCGQDDQEHWTIITSGGNGWQVEDPPTGADALPRELGYTSCFATSYHSCSKEQLIDLYSEGCPPYIMDNLQPCIEVSEWYTGRFDCGSIYELRVALLNAKEDEVADYSVRKTIKQWEGRQWKKVVHKFYNYGPGVRYIRFYHGGIDTQFWAGHYGSKMSGACVKIVPEGSPETDGTTSNSPSNNGDDDDDRDIGGVENFYRNYDIDDDSSSSSQNEES